MKYYVIYSELANCIAEMKYPEPSTKLKLMDISADTSQLIINEELFHTLYEYCNRERYTLCAPLNLVGNSSKNFHKYIKCKNQTILTKFKCGHINEVFVGYKTNKRIIDAIKYTRSKQCFDCALAESIRKDKIASFYKLNRYSYRKFSFIPFDKEQEKDLFNFSFTSNLINYIKNPKFPFYKDYSFQKSIRQHQIYVIGREYDRSFKWIKLTDKTFLAYMRKNSIFYQNHRYNKDDKNIIIVKKRCGHFDHDYIYGGKTSAKRVIEGIINAKRYDCDTCLQRNHAMTQKLDVFFI